MRERVPLSMIHEAVLAFLRGRVDAVVFGALAVNAYVRETRMTEDIDIMSTAARDLASELRQHLAERFHIAVRVREVSGGRGVRIYQAQRTGNRHLVDLRPVDKLPPARRVGGVLVIEPADLVATKVIALRQRRGSPKSGTDWRDIALLLLALPELKRDPGPVTERLYARSADESTLQVWAELVAQDIHAPSDEDEFA